MFIIIWNNLCEFSDDNKNERNEAIQYDTYLYEVKRAKTFQLSLSLYFYRTMRDNFESWRFIWETRVIKVYKQYWTWIGDNTLKWIFNRLPLNGERWWIDFEKEAKFFFST